MLVQTTGIRAFVSNKLILIYWGKLDYLINEGYQ